MKEIYFYTDENGKSQVDDYCKIYLLGNDKNSKINHNKIGDYLNALSYYGTNIGYPYVKYLRDKIWELRPLDNRILFFETNDCYVMLNTFKKQTNKTPINEIKKAKYLMKKYLERNKNDKR